MRQKIVLLFLVSAMLVSCDKDNDDDNLKVNISGLQDLGAGYAYEGWMIVNGNPVSTGTSE